MLSKSRQKSPYIFYCEMCNYGCSKTGDFNKHKLTRKHENRTNMNNLEQEKLQNLPLHICKICNKGYNARNSLWYHEKTCKLDNNNDNNETENKIVVQNKSDEQLNILTSLVMEVVKSNVDLQKQSIEIQKQVLDVCKNIQPSNNNNNSNNNSNNTFNMQVFLNEECKDAINLSDFVNSFEIKLEDLESVGRLGYATGVSNIIIKELKSLDVYKRPIHCSDARREIFYVKDNDIWERETPENSKVKKAIKGISHKNMVKLNDWRDEHPDCLDSSSAYNDIYLKLMLEACGGRGDIAISENKIFKNIIKEVLIKK
jgi:hypothetical protein